MPPSGRGTAIIAWFSMYSCSWWPTRYSPSMTSSASAKPASTSPLADREMGELLGRRERVEDGLERLGPQAGRVAWPRAASRDRARPAARPAPPGGGSRPRTRIGWSSADEADDVVAGDVLGRQDDDLRPVEGRIEVDAQQARVRLGRADRVRRTRRPGRPCRRCTGPCRSAWPGPRAQRRRRAPRRRPDLAGCRGQDRARQVPPGAAPFAAAWSRSVIGADGNARNRPKSSGSRC